MAVIIASTFSIQMLQNKNCRIDFTEISKEDFISEIQLADQNTVNPRHTATAALVDTVAPIKSAGGFASLKAHDTVLIILPPREFMSRSGNEVNVDDLDACQFTKAVVVGK